MLDNDCDEIFLDVFNTEIVPGEKYYENEYGEAIHKDNLHLFVLENGLCKVKIL